MNRFREGDNHRIISDDSLRTIRRALSSLQMAESLLTPGADADTVEHAADLMRSSLTKLRRRLEQTVRWYLSADEPQFSAGGDGPAEVLTLVAIVSGIRDELAPVLADRGNSLELTPADGAAVSLRRGDLLAEALTQIIRNAAENSERSAIQVSYAGGAEPRIVVRDRGPGIPADRLEAVRRAAAGGEPLNDEELRFGMAIAGRVVAGLGGTLDIAVDRGTVVTLRLGDQQAVDVSVAGGSRSDASAVGIPVADGARRERRRGRVVHDVLLVEDDAVNSLFAEQVISDAGYLVEAVSTGRAALERIACRPPDLLLLDLGLPDTSGVEILRELEALGVSGIMNIIIITAFADRKTAEELQEHRIDGMIIKPFFRDDLLKAVARLGINGAAL
jgi:CheY-like chemotaxis protein